MAEPGTDDAATNPSPAATTHAALSLLARVTRRHPVARQCLADGGARLLLTLPRACLLPNFARAEPSIVSVLLNMLEDPSTLEGLMETTIRGFFANRARARAHPYMPHPRGGPGPDGTCMVSEQDRGAQEGGFGVQTRPVIRDAGG